MRTRAGLVGVVCVALLPGCSALIQPDTHRLGGDDGGPSIDSGHGGGDAGAADAGTVDSGHAMCPASCDDGVACTTDSCRNFACAHDPDDTACGTGERCNPVMGCVPMRCESSAQCDDGRFCNGAETCDAAAPGTGCVAGNPPTCDDGIDCTVDGCDPDRDRCDSVRTDSLCDDGVDCTRDSCGSDGCRNETDDTLCASDFCTVGAMCHAVGGCQGGMRRTCDDANACTNDSCDPTAGACVNALRDDDGDGFGPVSVRTSGGVAMLCGGMDCDDSNGAVHPGATEACNRVDDNCNGTIDEGCSTLPDDCGSAQVLTLTAGAFSFPMPLPTLAGLRDDYQASAMCRPGTGGRDAVYAFDIVGRHDVTIDTIGSGATDTILAVSVNECSGDAFRARAVCHDDLDDVSRSSRVWLHRVGSGTAGVTTRIYVLVDGYDGTATGAYQLNIRVTDVNNDICGGATTRQLDLTGGGAVQGFVTDAISDYQGTCQGPGISLEQEGLFAFTGPPSGRVSFTGYSADFVPDLYIRSSCAGTEIACVPGTAGTPNMSTLVTDVTTGSVYTFFFDGGRVNYMLVYDPAP